MIGFRLGISSIELNFISPLIGQFNGLLSGTNTSVEDIKNRLPTLFGAVYFHQLMDFIDDKIFIHIQEKLLDFFKTTLSTKLNNLSKTHPKFSRFMALSHLDINDHVRWFIRFAIYIINLPYTIYTIYSSLQAAGLSGAFLISLGFVGLQLALNGLIEGTLQVINENLATYNEERYRHSYALTYSKTPQRPNHSWRLQKLIDFLNQNINHQQSLLQYLQLFLSQANTFIGHVFRYIFIPLYALPHSYTKNSSMDDTDQRQTNFIHLDSLYQSAKTYTSFSEYTSKICYFIDTFYDLMHTPHTQPSQPVMSGHISAPPRSPSVNPAPSLIALASSSTLTVDARITHPLLRTYKTTLKSGRNAVIGDNGIGKSVLLNTLENLCQQQNADSTPHIAPIRYSRIATKDNSEQLFPQGQLSLRQYIINEWAQELASDQAYVCQLNPEGKLPSYSCFDLVENLALPDQQQTPIAAVENTFMQYFLQLGGLRLFQQKGFPFTHLSRQDKEELEQNPSQWLNQCKTPNWINKKAMSDGMTMVILISMALTKAHYGLSHLLLLDEINAPFGDKLNYDLNQTLIQFSLKNPDIIILEVVHKVGSDTLTRDYQQIILVTSNPDQSLLTADTPFELYQQHTDLLIVTDHHLQSLLPSVVTQGDFVNKPLRVLTRESMGLGYEPNLSTQTIAM
tara:strand:+ start:1695 stop:3734 length:2040 start_codon:yes stop_codon:yes gene_type:complete